MEIIPATRHDTRMKRLVILFCTLVLAGVSPAADVEQWDVFELSLNGPSDGNPFVDVKLSAKVTRDGQAIECRGFYYGDGMYRILLSPLQQGVWNYQTTWNPPMLNGTSGEINCVKPSPRNHRPVVVRNTYHFGYADGTPFKPIG